MIPKINLQINRQTPSHTDSRSIVSTGMDRISRRCSVVFFPSYIWIWKTARGFARVLKEWPIEREILLPHHARSARDQSWRPLQQNLAVWEDEDHLLMASSMLYLHSQQQHGHASNSGQTKNFKKDFIRFSKTEMRFIEIVGFIRFVFQ